MRAELDGRLIVDRAALYDQLAAQLNLPLYFGRNLDALFDCLCEMNNVQIVVSYVQEMKDNLRRYADNIINVFEAAQEKNPKLSVIVEELVDEL